jgi:hypothetical protein
MHVPDYCIDDYPSSNSTPNEHPYIDLKAKWPENSNGYKPDPGHEEFKNTMHGA